MRAIAPGEHRGHCYLSRSKATTMQLPLAAAREGFVPATRPGALTRVRGERAHASFASAKQDVPTLSRADAGRLLDEVRERQLEVRMQAEALRRAQSELDDSRADRIDAMGALAAGFAHEIETPLAHVVTLGQNVATELPRLGSLLRRLRDAARRGILDVAVLDELLGDDAARLDGGLLSTLAAQAREALAATSSVRRAARSLAFFARVDALDLSRVDVNAPLAHALSLAAAELRRCGRLEQDLREVPPVWASPGKLVQVFVNLLASAARAISEGPADKHRVVVRTSASNQHVLVEISDTGALWTPRQPSLGLAISRHILLEFDGELQETHTAAQGRRVVVRLPALPATPVDANVAFPASRPEHLVE